MKVFVVTLAYAPARIFLTAIDQIYKTIGIDVEHHVLQQHYPVDEKRNSRLIEFICDEYGIHYHDLGENVGLSQGYNYLISLTGQDPNDIIIGADCDVYPVTKNWGKALVEIASFKEIGWTSLQNRNSIHELPKRGYIEAKTPNGTRIWQSHYPCTNSICAWRRETLIELNGLKEPKKYYGGIECQMFGMLNNLYKAWVYLPDYEEMSPEIVQSEPLYKEYKFEYALKNSTNLEFKDWLKNKEGLNV